MNTLEGTHFTLPWEAWRKPFMGPISLALGSLEETPGPLRFAEKYPLWKPL